MWRLVVSVVLWSTISSQPVTEENARAPRQLDFGECCPCTDTNRHAQDFSRSSQGLGPWSTGPQHLDPMAGASHADFVARSSPVDDCPCRLRDDDSEGSPSVFFPRAMRPVRPVMMPENAKEEPKPLLHPEVDLASSVLETLREVTDEEYQEALARDAARNAARVSELGETVPETAKNVVTIIVNPDEELSTGDAAQEASEVQESRCMHPLTQVRDSTPSTFKLQSLPSDMDNGASEVKEQVVGINKGLEGLRLKTTPQLLKLFPNRKPTEKGNVQSLLKLKINKPLKDAPINPQTLGETLQSKIPALRLPLFKNKNNEEKTQLKPLNLDLGLHKLNIPKFKLPQARKSILSDNDDLDVNPAASSVQEQITDLRTKNSIPKIGSPLSLTNLLNLKDVELIPTNSPKPLLPGLPLLPTIRINKPGTPFFKDRKIKTKKINCINKGKVTTEAEKIQTPGNKHIETEILDALPKPSENIPVVVPFTNNLDANTDNQDPNVPVVPKSKSIKTEILDALPSASENHEAIIASDTETTTSGFEEDPTDTDVDSEEHDETVTETNKKKPKDNFDYGESEGETDIIIDDDGNFEFVEVEIDDQKNEPANDIEISGDALDNQDLEIEIDNDDGTNSGLQFGDGFEIIDGHEFSEIKNIDSEPEQESQSETENNSNEFNLFREKDNQNEENDFSAEPSNLNIETVQGETEFTPSNTETVDHTTELIEPVSPKDWLPSVKDRITLKLKTLKQPNTKVLTISRLSKPVETKSNQFERSAFDSEESSVVEPLSEDSNKYPNVEKSASLENSEAMQNIPNPSIENYSNLEHRSSEQAINSNLSGDTEIRGEESATERNAKAGKASDIDSSTTSDANVLTLPESGENVEEVTDENADQELRNTDNTCLTVHDTINSKTLAEAVSSSSRNSEVSTNEMMPEASAPMFNTLELPKMSSLPNLQQNAGDPLPLFDINNLFRPVQPLDLNNLPGLPTLDSISSGITHLFGGAGHTSVEDKSSSAEFNTAEDCTDTDTGASTKSLRKSLSPIRPLEDVNLDIFQISPLGQSSPLFPKLPSLKSNSFKTKLSLPRLVEPMKLQSALRGKNGGLIGATLTLGPEKVSSSRKTKPVNLSNIQRSDILRNSLGNLPSLEDLTSQMRANAQSLLKSPLTKQINDPIEDTLRATQTLGNSLRSHTENTMRNVQQSLASTLQGATVSNTGEKFAKPQDLLQRVASAHEDMNDKLQAIHIDLKDRLESLHDHIKDQTNLPALRSPLLDTFPKLELPLLSTPKSPTLLHSSTQKKLSSKKPKPKIIVKTRKPDSTRGRSTDHSEQVRPFKMSKAASSLTPKSIEVPKLTTTSSKPPFFKPLQRDSNVQLKEVRPVLVTERPKSPKHGILISSKTRTTPTSSSSSRNVPQSTKTLLRTTTRPRTQESEQSRSTKRPVGHSKHFSDARGFASEPKSIRVPPPKPISKSASFEVDDAPIPDDAVLSKPKSIKDFNFKPQKPINFKTATTLAPLKTTLAPKLSLPKPTDSPLLTKMRESLRIRLSRPLEPKKTKASIPIDDDMSRSASEANTVMLSATPMKENVSYKCKMVCVRE